MSWRVRVWCRDCCGEDPQGCFGGSDSWIESDDLTSDAPKEFATREEAEAAGDEYTKGPPWDFEVEESP